MNVPTSAQPRALVACFGVAVVLGLGFGFVIGDIKQSRATSGRSVATQAPDADRTGSTPPPTTAPALVDIACRVKGPPVALTGVDFVAGVADGGSVLLADAFMVKERRPVPRDELNDADLREGFENDVLGLSQDLGPGVLLVQQGQIQRQIANRVAKVGVVVVVVFPSTAARDLISEYPPGTLGVFVTARNERLATLTAPQAADVLRVLLGRAACEPGE